MALSQCNNGVDNGTNFHSDVNFADISPATGTQKLVKNFWRSCVCSTKWKDLTIFFFKISILKYMKVSRWKCDKWNNCQYCFLLPFWSKHWQHWGRKSSNYPKQSHLQVLDLDWSLTKTKTMGFDKIEFELNKTNCNNLIVVSNSFAAYAGFPACFFYSWEM